MIGGTNMGASPSATGLAGAEAPEPSGLGPSDGIPSAVDIAALGADTIYALDDPECCYCTDDASELLDWSYDGPGFTRHVGLVREVARLWMVKIPIAFDDEGWPDESEIRYFPTEAEAKAAYAIAMEARKGTDAERLDGEAATARASQEASPK